MKIGNYLLREKVELKIIYDIKNLYKIKTGVMGIDRRVSDEELDYAIDRLKDLLRSVQLMRGIMLNE
jgi:hypothetical protein